MRARFVARFVAFGLLAIPCWPQTRAANSYAEWVEGSTYSVGAVVSYQGNFYQALVYQTDYVGAGWNPAASPTLWKSLGTNPGGAAPAPTPTPPSAPTQPCSNIWSATAIYLKGAIVTENGLLYQANWWTQGNNPATSSGGAGSGQPWTLSGSCGSTVPTPPPVTPPTPTPPPNPPPVSTPPSNGGSSGTVSFHLLLGAGTAQDSLTLDGDNYTDLIMSNIVAGVMMGHLIQEGYPGLQFNRDYLYGSLLGQLLQENIETQKYQASGELIDPSPDQVAVMGTGQGGPYQINNYAADLVSGTYTPAGHSLINYVALQKSIGFTFAMAGTQYTKPTPASFNDKYFGPMLTAYFHYNDLVALNVTGKGPGGWTTPWEPAFDNALNQFKTLPNAFLDVLLNVAYNQGYYGPLVSSYSKLGATATPATVTTVDSFASVWGSKDTYQQYPYQVRYYLNQFYDLPDPSASPSALVTPTNHVIFPMSTLANVFASVYGTLSYVDASGHIALIPQPQAQTAFGMALTQLGVPVNAKLDLSVASDRAMIFNVLERATGNLETSLNTQFVATSVSQVP